MATILQTTVSDAYSRMKVYGSNFKGVCSQEAD